MLKKILNHIHTILLLIGTGSVSYGFFLIDEVTGFIGSGILISLLAALINIERR